MHKILIFGTILLALGLVGCDSLIKNFIPEKPAAQGRAVFDGMRKGDYRPLLTVVDPALRAKLTPDLLEKMRGVFGKQSVKTVGSNTNTSPDAKTYNLTYEYELGDRWVIAQIVLLALQGGRTQVEAVNVTPMSRSIEDINAFTFSGKSIVHPIFLAAALLIAAFSITTAVVCWRTPIPRRKWLWRIFVLVSFGSLSLNWATGELRYQIFNFLLFGAAFTKGFYGPVLLTLGFPLGAIVFWWRRKAWLTPPAPASEI